MASDGTGSFCLILGLNGFFEATRFGFFEFDFLDGGAIACLSGK